MRDGREEEEEPLRPFSDSESDSELDSEPERVSTAPIGPPAHPHLPGSPPPSNTNDPLTLSQHEAEALVARKKHVILHDIVKLGDVFWLFLLLNCEFFLSFRGFFWVSSCVPWLCHTMVWGFHAFSLVRALLDLRGSRIPFPCFVGASVLRTSDFYLLSSFVFRPLSWLWPWPLVF